MADPDHTTEPLTLETAIERTGRPLKPLFEAAAAWRAVEKPTLILAKRIVDEPWRTNILRPQIAYERELGETTAHFIRLLATGALAIQVRPWDRLAGPLSPLRPDEASQLSIKVDPSAKSLTLHGPGGERLFYELSAPAPDASAPAVDPYRTGAQGRPTASHLVKAEFKRRLESRAPDALKEEAADLLKWLAKEHPDAPPMAQETIQNVIRDAWRIASTKTTRVTATKPTKRPTK